MKSEDFSSSVPIIPAGEEHLGAAGIPTINLSDMSDVSINLVDDFIKFSEIEGRKFDDGKLEYGLLPPLALKAVVDVLTFGAQKYERDNWKYVEDSKRRYFDAMQRHLWAWKEGEINDPESGRHHLAHAMCCLMFLYEHDVKYSTTE
jgi:hypothetical protein